MMVNRKRLETLGIKLANLSRQYNQEHFNMGTYFSHNDGEVHAFDAIPDIVEGHFCGTVACAAGHIPMTFPRAFKEHLKKNSDDTNWDRVIEAILGIDTTTASGYQLYTMFFSGNWALSAPFDMTSWGAADRIAYFLEEGPRPGPFEFTQAAEWSRGYSVRAGFVTEARYVLNQEDAKKFGYGVTAHGGYRHE
jgi:hypothetical protein